MDIAFLERVLPHIAWPLTALIALPFVLGRIDKIARLYDLIQSDKLADFINRLNAANENIRSLKETINSVDEDRIEEDAIQLQARNDNLVELDEGKINKIRALKPDEMFENIRSKWNHLTEAIRAKIGDVDLRTIGSSAIRLSDKRRRNPLSPEDTKLVADLHSQFKRFTRLQSTASDWLTPEIYLAFVDGVDGATEKVRRVGERS